MFVYGQSARADKLKTITENLNNAARYDSSLKLVQSFLNLKDISSEEEFNAYIILSVTHKRLFDYDKVIYYLNKAELCVDKIKKDKQLFYNKVNCQKAFAFFDTKKLDSAETIMKNLKQNNYSGLSDQNVAILLMQEGYLSYHEKNYNRSSVLYNQAIEKMIIASPCDLPIIYGKQISLYGAMGKKEAMLNAYKYANRCADSCHMTKYNMYAAQVMHKTCRSLKDYTSAYKYLIIYDSIKRIYNANEYKSKLAELEVVYETKKKEQELRLNDETIRSNKRLIALLIIAIGTLILLVALYITIQRRKKLTKEKLQSQLFTKQLLNKTEEERKRIAKDLHDSVNNDLLLIKSSLQKNVPHEIEPKIDQLMNHVRTISRNLHPVLFEELGLQDSIEQLAERVQQHNQFILNTELNYKAGTLSIDDELQLYRIIQEAVNNMLKYSNALAGFIFIKQTNKKIKVEIKDNGKGFEVEETLKSKKAFGLHNILERSRAINGVPNIVSGTSGTYIQIEIKLT